MIGPQRNIANTRKAPKNYELEFKKHGACLKVSEDFLQSRPEHGAKRSTANMLRTILSILRNVSQHTEVFLSWQKRCCRTE